MISSILILLGLILINGLFAASEIALVSVSRNKVKLKADQGDKSAKVLLKAIEDPSKFLATIQIGISLTGLFSGAYAANTFTDPLVNFLLRIQPWLSREVLAPVIFFLITLILSYFILVFGELVPKRLGMAKPMGLANSSIRVLNVLAAVVKPFVMVLSFSTDFVLRLVGIDDKVSQDDVTEEEIRMLVESGSEHGSIAELEHDMINNIFEFDNMTAEDICIHRVDVTALPVDAEEDELIELLTEGRYSRIPIYEESIDDILGILHVKDVMKHLVQHGRLEDLDIRSLLREPFFVPFSRKADELFHDMQRTRVHMAIVIDEYGGTLGVITMEDLVEEIMGNIFDEHDAIEMPDITQVDETHFVINGATELEVVEEYFGVNLPTEDYDTLSGFLIGELGHIPSETEKPELSLYGLHFKVESVQEKRIASISVSKLASEETQNDE